MPIDYNGNPGTRKAATYTYLGASTATLTAISWTLNAAGSYPSTPRTYDFAWTPSGVADGTHYLTVYVQADARPEEVLFTEGSPNSVTSATNQATDYYARTGDPDHRQVFRWELRLDAGDALASSGLVSPSAGDEFQGGVVP